MGFGFNGLWVYSSSVKPAGHASKQGAQRIWFGFRGDWQMEQVMRLIQQLQFGHFESGKLILSMVVIFHFAAQAVYAD